MKGEKNSIKKFNFIDIICSERRFHLNTKKESKLPNKKNPPFNSSHPTLQ